MRRLNLTALVASALLLSGWAFSPTVGLAEEPQRGGILKVSLSGDPPSLDMHQEQTFLVTIPISTIYNTLVVFDPHGYPNIIGDLAKSWERSEDGKTWTFKLQEGVKFHDGAELTSADVKASWDKIYNPPKGFISTRRSDFEMIESTEAPDK
jgi:peptide/nickel transport system substrate-binding protein